MARQTRTVFHPPASTAVPRPLGATILAPVDAGYDDARRVYNGRVDKRPSLIVQCASVSDVVATVRLAREGEQPLAIRGGGHSAAGYGVCDGGIVADLRPMRGIRVDARGRIARVGAGCTWGDVDAATAPLGLATTGCRISSVGVAGSTLGGGYGWLMRRCGLAVDNLLAVDVVLADGTVARADPSSNEDLFWAVRGGGGNFGIVTALTFRLHEMPDSVIGGMLFYSSWQAGEVVAAYRELMATASDDLCAQCNVLIAPPVPFVPAEMRGKPVVAIPVCHLAPPAQAERELAPLRRLKPVVDRVRPMQYPKLQRLFDAAGVFGRLAFGRSGHLRSLSDEVMRVFMKHAMDITSPFSIAMISPLGGAVARIDEHATAFGSRQTSFDCAIDAVWVDPSETPRHVRWVENFWAEIRPFTSGVYVNELGDEGTERIRAAYHPLSYARLARIKRRVDPANLFRLNQNIQMNADEQEVPRC
jgi:FAD/FMN-containing dehydrogenase